MITPKDTNHIGNCPVCGEELIVTGLYCDFCRTQLNGKFSRCRFCHLSEEQLHFVSVFLDCRGNIKEVEKELNISYPTVRNRLEEVRGALGFSTKESQERGINKRDILEALDRGEVTAKEALKLLGPEKR